MRILTVFILTIMVFSLGCGSDSKLPSDSDYRAVPAFTKDLVLTQIGNSGISSRIMYYYDIGQKNKRKVTDLNSLAMHRASWNPDGSAVAYIDIENPFPLGSDDSDIPYELYRIQSDGGVPEKLTDFDEEVIGFCWSPDGSKFAVIVRYENGANSLYTMDSDGSNQQMIYDCPIPVSGMYNLIWDDSTQKLYFIGRDLDGALDQTAGFILYSYSLQDDVQELMPLEIRNIYDLRILKGGNEFLIAALSGVYRGSSSGMGFTELFSFDSTSNITKFSPDGTKIVFKDLVGDQKQLYVADIDGSNRKEISISDQYEEFIGWSPEGSKLLFIGNFDDITVNVNGETVLTNGQALVVTNADGSDPVRIAEDKMFVGANWHPNYGNHD